MDPGGGGGGGRGGGRGKPKRAVDEKERREDPEEKGKVYKFADLKKKYADSFSEDEIIDYWLDVCTPDANEKRICPDDDKTYTFAELTKAYGNEFSEKDLKAYWKDTCKPI
eukprot:gnl/MRDRNA2_/MRDRNA2_27219_c0_seq1.p2 gnl/MRDRNA2_/MRDRNA2_27219_c0~~gnl/MRDRNA2_/MRDRNA2_27219_c0_seq1.p2  ORF type:complete len:111 (-),score=26.25 gnl/MRDRNA2_/MRDRNA2_27219_c0_seq1:15-347(-)